MSKTIRFAVVLSAAVLFAGAVSFAQSAGEATYKAKCQSCHGAEGTPNAGIAKADGRQGGQRSLSEGDSAAEMIAITNSGKGKMPAFKGKLTDAQIKDSVDYFRSLAK